MRSEKEIKNELLMSVQALDMHKGLVEHYSKLEAKDKLHKCISERTIIESNAHIYDLENEIEDLKRELRQLSA